MKNLKYCLLIGFFLIVLSCSEDKCRGVDLVLIKQIFIQEMNLAPKASSLGIIGKKI